MAKNTLHILAAGAASVEDLRCSSLASHRLRLAVAAEGCMQSKICEVTVGESILGKPKVVLVGKIGANSIATRSAAWVREVEQAIESGSQIVVDYTDHHLGFDSPMKGFYEVALNLAQLIIVPSHELKAVVSERFSVKVHVVPDPLEYEILPPKERGTKIGVWFGHGSNAPYLLRYFQEHNVAHHFDELVICTDEATLFNIKNSPLSRCLPPTRAVRWSVENQQRALRDADFAFLPVGWDDKRKSGASANRLLTSLCLGLPVFTQGIASYRTFQRLYVDIGVGNPLWMQAITDLRELRGVVTVAQKTVLGEFSKDKITQFWRSLLIDFLIFKKD